MADSYESWKAFVDAGFELGDDGALHLGTDAMDCRISRRQSNLEIDLFVTGLDNAWASTDFPLTVSSLQYWAALFARRVFGTHEMYQVALGAAKDDFPGDLMSLVEYGFDHEDELPPTEGVRAEPDENDDGASQEGHDEKLADELRMYDALIVVRRFLKSVGEADQRRLEEAVKEGSVERVKSLAARLGELEKVSRSIDAVEKIWIDVEAGSETIDIANTNEPAGTVIEKESLESDKGNSIRKNVQPSRSNAKPRPKVVVRQHVSGIRVVFPDGTVIAEKKLGDTFTKAVEKIGPEQVAAQGFTFAGDPVVTRNPDEITKMPFLKRPVGDGWWLKTQGNVFHLIDVIEKTAQAIGMDVKVERIYSESKFIRGKRSSRKGDSSGQGVKQEDGSQAFRLEADSVPPNLFDNLDLFQADSGTSEGFDDDLPPDTMAQEDAQKNQNAGESNEWIDAIPEKGVQAATIKRSFRDTMKRLYYTPHKISLGMKVPYKVVKCWYKGFGTIPKDQYIALCKFLGVKGLIIRE